MTQLRDLVAASDATAATSARNEKVAAMAAVLASVEPQEIATSVALLSGEPKQGRVGVGWATVAAAVDEIAGEGSAGGADAENTAIQIADVDEAIETIAATHGEGSAAERRSVLESLFRRATDAEARFLRAVLTGGLRQGALAGVVTSAAAKAYGVKLGSLRRASMLLGDLGEAATIAAIEGEQGLAEVGLHLGRPIQPMLASTAESIEDAMTLTGRASVEWKLDGIRIQVHRSGDDVWVFTRNLNDITDRTAGVVEAVRSLEPERLVLDGEVLGSEPHFFDVLHVDGEDLLDQPLDARMAVLDVVAPDHRIPAVVTDDVDTASAHLRASIDAGHEGAMVKDLSSTYDAGRRGKGWRKVKPVHTLDLVVLGAEWGHGRRQGWLSNLHLGARDPQSGDFVMVGKTFKGMTDAMLEWQTAEFLDREVRREGIAVFIRPELVVEVAVDSSHESTRYPGGVALRFARVRRYRDDKDPVDADTIYAVRALMVDLPAGETWQP